MSRRALWLSLALVAFALIAAAYLFLWHARPSVLRTAPASSISATATSSLQFEIADTEAKQALGLGNRASIPDNYAMLFVFQKPDRYGFWMKDMFVPIDITWLDGKGTIILVDHAVDPATYPHVFYPPTPVTYVLETRAGYARDHGWDIGTHIPLPAPYGQ